MKHRCFIGGKKFLKNHIIIDNVDLIHVVFLFISKVPFIHALHSIKNCYNKIFIYTVEFMLAKTLFDFGFQNS